MEPSVDKLSRSTTVTHNAASWRQAIQNGANRFRILAEASESTEKRCES
jgi:hypothetical protein